MRCGADGPNAEPVVARLRMRMRAEAGAPLTIGRATAAPGIDPMTLIDLAKSDRREIPVSEPG